MSLVFADTFFYLALLSDRDAAHQRAVDYAKQFKGRTITTAWVLTETADALASANHRLHAAALIRQLEADPTLTIIPPEDSDFQRGLKLYESRPDKHWSLTDCISFVVMDQNGVAEALTGDTILNKPVSSRYLNRDQSESLDP